MAKKILKVSFKTVTVQIFCLSNKWLQKFAERLLANITQFVFRVLDVTFMKTPPKHSLDFRMTEEAALL